MNKRKMRAFAWATAAVLAFVPFLGGCAAETDNNEVAQQELANDEQERNVAEGSIGQEYQYGQVMAVNGNEATVALGQLNEAQDGSGGKTFTLGNNEITFDMSVIPIVDETNAGKNTLSADDVVYMQGEGTGSDFQPTSVTIVDVADAGSNTSDGMVPQGME